MFLSFRSAVRSLSEIIYPGISRVSLLALWPYRGFHKSGYPQMDGLGWFMVEKPIKLMDDLGVLQF